MVLAAGSLERQFGGLNRLVPRAICVITLGTYLFEIRVRDGGLSRDEFSPVAEEPTGDSREDIGRISAWIRRGDNYE